MNVSNQLLITLELLSKGILLGILYISTIRLLIWGAEKAFIKKISPDKSNKKVSFYHLAEALIIAISSAFFFKPPYALLIISFVIICRIIHYKKYNTNYDSFLVSNYILLLGVIALIFILGSEYLSNISLDIRTFVAMFWGATLMSTYIYFNLDKLLGLNKTSSWLGDKPTLLMKRIVVFSIVTLLVILDVSFESLGLNEISSLAPILDLFTTQLFVLLIALDRVFGAVYSLYEEKNRLKMYK